MKKAILGVLILIIFLSGCINNPGKEIVDIESTSPDSSNYIDNLKTISPENTATDPLRHETSLGIIYPAFLDGKYYNLVNWQEYIQNKFGISIELSYKTISPSELHNLDLGSNILYLSYADNMVYQFNTQIFNYVVMDSFYDLTPYYNRYNWDENIDPQHISKLIGNEGISAVPAYDKKYVVPRYYNSELLSKIGMSVPRTTAEFHEFLRAARAYNNDRADYYPMFTTNLHLSVSTSDIFRAFNVFLNSEFNSSIAYNPTTETIEDGVFSPDMETGLQYIRMLQNERLFGIASLGKQQEKDGITENKFLTDFSSIDKVFATEYGAIYDSRYDFFILDSAAEVGYDYIEGYFLEGTNTKNVCEVRQNISFYLFPKSIENIDGVIELFDMVFSKTEYYYDVKYGIEDRDYYIDESTGQVLAITPSKGSFVGLHTINGQIAEEYNVKGRNSIDDISSGNMFIKNIFTQVFAYADDREDLSDYMNTYSLDSIFNDNLIPLEAINEYKTIFIKSGGVGLIMNLNSNLGKTSGYDYSSP
ncbi:MAG: hypothetical protein JXN10_12240 [Clostridia bacterium]|nr:hypothetical protein [Clostridia bacterium]